MLSGKIRKYKSCVFPGFYVTSYEYGRHGKEHSTPAKPTATAKGVGSFPIAKAENRRYAQAMDNSIAKNTKTAKARESKSKRKEGIKPVVPSVQTIVAPCEPHDNSVTLNQSHDTTKVVLLPVDPYTVHVYWELDSEGQKQAGKVLGRHFLKSRPILRFYDITNLTFDGTNAHGFFDIPVDLSKRTCYVHLQSPQKTYFVDVGWKTEQGRFFCVGRSNTAHTPRAWPTENGDHLPEQPPSPPDRTRDSVKTGKHHIFDSAKGNETGQRPHLLDSSESALRTPSSKTVLHADLSAMSESAFESGVSSTQTASSPDGEDGRKDER